MDSFDYCEFRIKRVTDKIQSEIDFYTNCEYCKASIVQKYLTYLNSRLYSDKPVYNKPTYYNKAGDKFEIQSMNWDEYGKEMNIMVFKKPWTKLREFHKIMKINEFVNSLKYGSKVEKSVVDQNRAKISKKIIRGLKNKKFGKHKSEIIYDEVTMKITSISCLSYSKTKGYYRVDWDE